VAELLGDYRYFQEVFTKEIDRQDMVEMTAVSEDDSELWFDIDTVR